MLDLREIVCHKDEIIRAMLRRTGGAQLAEMINNIVVLDQKRRTLIQSVEDLKARRNLSSQEIAKIKKAGGDPGSILTKMKTVADTIRCQDAELATCQEEIHKCLLEIPNRLQEDVPEGKDASSNIVLSQWGTPRSFSFSPKSHDEIGEQLGVLDFARAGVVTGARFVFLRGIAARLERALIQMMMDTHAANGYEEMIPPFIVNRMSLVGTGNLPKFEEDLFRLHNTDYFLIPTAEVPVTNYHRGEILSHHALPVRFTAYSPCFRSEAGSYGKDTKGMKRQHQFQKVELVTLSHPDASDNEHKRLTQDAERILKLLELPYRVVMLCSGDTSFASSKTYDLEVWSPGAGQFMEISSCSNFSDFQARRANIRFRDESGKTRFVHTLNGSGLAIGRTVIAIMENYQLETGGFEIPKILRHYMDPVLGEVRDRGF